MILVRFPDANTWVCESNEAPDVDKVYSLEDATEGTGRQNKAFHALVSEYYRCGLHSYQASNFSDFRNQIKKHLGAGFEAFVYATVENGKPVIHDAPTYADIPETVRHDPDLRNLARGRLKSWSDYTKKERRETLDRLISEMLQVGVNTPKFEEILAGMERGNR